MSRRVGSPKAVVTAVTAAENVSGESGSRGVLTSPTPIFYLSA
jgi:hypothetical protein